MMPVRQAIGPLVEAGRGEAAGLDTGLIAPRAVATVRYADPVAWAAATAVARAMAAFAERLGAQRDRVGVVVASAEGPTEAIAAVAKAAREGYPSAMRYPAANPSSLAGVTCIAFGFRGPTLSLLAAPGEGAAMALFMAGRWLGRGDAAAMAVAVCGRRAAGPVLARALIVEGCEGRPDLAPLDPEFAAAWLSAPFHGTAPA
jgi:hypothetical protein